MNFLLLIPALVVCAWFGLCYAIKGGSGRTIFENWAEVRSRNAFFERLLDGKIMSTIMAFGMALIGTSSLLKPALSGSVPAEYVLNFEAAVWFAAAWLISVAPSMGEEHGAIGRIGKAWGSYLKWMPQQRNFNLFGKTLFTYIEGRDYGIKKGIQRGVWIGAVMTIFTGYLPFLYFGFLFVPSVFIGQELNYRIRGKEGWALSEPIIGALCYGPPAAMYFAQF